MGGTLRLININFTPFWPMLGFTLCKEKSLRWIFLQFRKTIRAKNSNPEPLEKIVLFITPRWSLRGLLKNQSRRHKRGETAIHTQNLSRRLTTLETKTLRANIKFLQVINGFVNNIANLEPNKNKNASDIFPLPDIFPRWVNTPHFFWSSKYFMTRWLCNLDGPSSSHSIASRPNQTGSAAAI